MEGVEGSERLPLIDVVMGRIDSHSKAGCMKRQLK